ncbi:MAG: bifunctional hydroxymethylpyrimidine kinase/phosphomethylpyrimidine kinase [Bacteroidales bacterium]|nr:bifunctional hydroxymethylpyrimidine kinase/phosphomethylpyrimidine kinase [Candidatus Liminaster caballi]
MYIVITRPQFTADEADAITAKFQSGLQRLHLRKPDSSIDDYRRLLSGIPACYHSRIVIHEHFQLLDEFSLCGVHLNRRNPEAPAGWTGHISCSCHTLEEVREKKARFDYVTLSPIFDSISKQGYASHFSIDQLEEAHRQGIIDGKVCALGGVTPGRTEMLHGLGFGHIMVLGDAWVQPELPVVLTIAGSDPCAGAGIQQDLKTITHCGAYGATVITALTSQNTLGVQHVMPVPAEVVASQIRSVFDDLRVEAVKIGMIPNAEVARVIIDALKQELSRRNLPIVCDPIMLSTSGTRLMSQDCISLIVRELFPLCTLVTPNLPEYESLPALHTDITLLPSSILVKGGHADGDEMTDTLMLRDEGRTQTFTSPRIPTTNLHGTGCTLSSAIASQLAFGRSLIPAIANAKRHMDCAISGGRNLHIGHGNGPLWFN